MSFAILFHFLCAQHVLDINISIIGGLRLFCWITTLVCSWFDVCWSFGVVGLEWYPCCRLKHNWSVSDINISIIRGLRLFCWVTTLVIFFLVRKRNSNTHQTKNNTGDAACWCHQQAASPVHYTTSCKHILVLLVTNRQHRRCIISQAVNTV